LCEKCGWKDFFQHRTGAPPRRVYEELAGPPIYSGGEVAFLEERLGFQGDRVIYFGDHTYGDILRSKKTVGWRTAMVIEELERDSALETIRPVDELARLGPCASG
jgi:hypothetical protein